MIQITLDETQLAILGKACHMYARIMGGQFAIGLEPVTMHMKFNEVEQARELIKQLEALPHGRQLLNEDAQVAFEAHVAIRHWQYLQLPAEEQARRSAFVDAYPAGKIGDHDPLAIRRDEQIKTVKTVKAKAAKKRSATPATKSQATDEEPPLDLAPFHALASGLNGIYRQAASAYEPIVDDIIRSRSRDTQHIEHTLDHLLGFACNDSCLVLFKKLCRYYWDIDQNASAAHVLAYREMWDEESLDKPSEKSH
jgi:hypothetical protein